jgi:hypothetical protein
MRRARVAAAEVPASKAPASDMPSPRVLRPGNGSLKAGASQHTGSDEHNFSKDRTAKDKARHTGTLPAASRIEAARFARTRYH